MKSFCLSLSPLLGWTEGEGERSSVTARLSPNHRVSVCSTLWALILFLHPVPLVQLPTLYISKMLTHPLCICASTLHNTHALHMHTRQYVHTYICTYVHSRLPILVSLCVHSPIQQPPPHTIQCCIHNPTKWNGICSLTGIDPILDRSNHQVQTL